MSNTERLYKIEGLIRQHGHVSFRRLQDALEVSRATLKRDLEYLRSRLGAPIVYDRELNGYRLQQDPRGERHELPGLWFDERELYSLLAAHQLLASLDDGGTLARHLQPLLQRVREMIGGDAEGADAALMQRVRIVASARREVPARHFQLVAEALLERRRLHLRYLTRARGEVGERDVSPQRLVHYRNTWYLDAWCHRARALRRFALDAVEQAELLDDAARELPLEQVERAMDAGYGIYAGGQRQWARVRFSAPAAAWVAREAWHPEQEGTVLDDGRYELRLPYTDDTELLMDLMRHGAEAEVLEPAALRDKLAARLRAAAAVYGEAVATG